MVLDPPASPTSPRVGESRWPMALAVLAAGGLRAALPAQLRDGDARWAFGAVAIILSWPYAFFVMTPLDNQVRALRGPDVAAARALVRQWGLVETGLTGLGIVAVAFFVWVI